jgi:hypothetical protein
MGLGDIFFYSRQMAAKGGSDTCLCASRYYSLDFCWRMLRGLHNLKLVSGQSVLLLGCGLKDLHIKRGLLLGRGRRFLCSPKRRDRLWDPSSPVFSGYRQLFPDGKSANMGNLTTHMKCRYWECMELHTATPPIYLYGVANNRHWPSHLI